jgi:hypothetical protein
MDAAHIPVISIQTPISLIGSHAQTDRVIFINLNQKLIIFFPLIRQPHLQNHFLLVKRPS